MSEKEGGIMAAIAGFQACLFNGRFSELNTAFTAVADELAAALPMLTEEQQRTLAAKLNPVLEAYARQDFLLTADMLEYEVRPVLERECG